MPYGYGNDMGGSDIGAGIRRAGESIAQGIRERAARAERKRKEEARKRREQFIAKSKLMARGVPYTAEYDQIIDSGGTSDDVVETATAAMKKKSAEDAQRAAEAESFSAAETSGREASAGVQRGRDLLKNAQFRAMPADDPRRQSIADAYLHGSMAQQREAVKALEPEKPPKPEKATQSEIDRGARRRYWEDAGRPEGKEWRLWIMTGAGQPDKAGQFPSAAEKSSLFEGEYKKLAAEEKKRKDALAQPSSFDPGEERQRRRALLSPERTPQQIRDSAMTYSENMAAMEGQAANVGEVPAAQEEALRERIRRLRERLDRLEGRK